MFNWVHHVFEVGKSDEQNTNPTKVSPEDGIGSSGRGDRDEDQPGSGLDPTFYRTPANAIAAPPERLAYVADYDPAGPVKDG